MSDFVFIFNRRAIIVHIYGGQTDISIPVLMCMYQIVTSFVCLLKIILWGTSGNLTYTQIPNVYTSCFLSQYRLHLSQRANFMSLFCYLCLLHHSQNIFFHFQVIKQVYLLRLRVFISFLGSSGI